jgi:hypothetical protein
MHAPLVRFLGITENSREYQKDLAELSQRVKEGKSLYGESSNPEWIQGAAYRNSVFSWYKFGSFAFCNLLSLFIVVAVFPVLNLVNHPYHGTDPAKYGSKPSSQASELPSEES